MTEEELDKLKYPIGTYVVPEVITKSHIDSWIDIIRVFPKNMNALVAQLSAEEKAWSYRPGGWSIKQVVHHCADSHINSYVRFKWALTEDTPVIKAYDENTWAALSDGNEDDLSATLLLTEGLHAKWSNLLMGLSDQDLERTFIHPNSNKSFSLKETIGSYAWHCEQHLAHIKQAINLKGDFSSS